VKAVASGKLRSAIEALDPVKVRGPWHVLCDGERFLHTTESQAAVAESRVKTWTVPAKSPDLNPVEKFWGWLRKELRKKDMEDLQAKRPVIDKAQYKARIRALIATVKAQRAAKKFAGDLRRACKEVVQKKGQRSRG
jgi:hypothetical protein